MADSIYGNAENIQEELNNTAFSAHHLIAYPDLATLRKVYSHYINAALNVKNETVIVLPFFETTDTVRRALRESEFDIDVTKHEKQRSLLVMDSLKGYFGSPEGVTQIIKRAVEDAKISGKNGVSVLGDLGSFFYDHKDNDLIDYELSLPSKYDDNLKGFCLYNKREFDLRLTEQQRQKLLEHHGKNMIITTT
jgi:MEDS: MEthanogen/methylotroph, DcmR Sensory domain